MKTIEQLAEEAGVNTATLLYGDWKALEHFAALVAERCAAIAQLSADADVEGGASAATAAETIFAEFPKP